ncbi:OLC1v1030140C1 [Oldenlandia corymbosa var. corymbosa]|uniref:OLC1v1030140C1 n=1 Tax=Oldenlandia corymbosa var. corymbosa TaxID=529605 RepID=A0AAV1CIB9_OLDCO|nr:OLC1v1030140C1 [Oldenlandia corymbosa var. corymbosa]
MAKTIQNGAIIFIFVLTIAAFLPLGTSDLMETTCQKTRNPELCEYILRHDPRSYEPNADLKVLTLVVIDSLISKTDYTLKAIKQMLIDRPELKIPLDECGNQFALIRNFYIRDAIVAVNSGNPKLGEDMMFSVNDAAHLCDAAFKPNPSPFVNINAIFYDIADITSAMFTQMQM